MGFNATRKLSLLMCVLMSFTTVHNAVTASHHRHQHHHRHLNYCNHDCHDHGRFLRHFGTPDWHCPCFPTSSGDSFCWAVSSSDRPNPLQAGQVGQIFDNSDPLEGAQIGHILDNFDLLNAGQTGQLPAGWDRRNSGQLSASLDRRNSFHQSASGWLTSFVISLKTAKLKAERTKFNIASKLRGDDVIATQTPFAGFPLLHQEYETMTFGESVASDYTRLASLAVFLEGATHDTRDHHYRCLLRDTYVTVIQSLCRLEQISLNQNQQVNYCVSRGIMDERLRALNSYALRNLRNVVILRDAIIVLDDIIQHYESVQNDAQSLFWTLLNSGNNR